VFIDRALVVVESVIFADALVDATMQDGGKRERSIVWYGHIEGAQNKL